MTHPTTPEEQLQLIVEASTTLLLQAVPAAPEALLGLVMYEVQSQQGYERVLEDLVSPEARVSHPYWGFSIAGVNPKTNERVEIARTLVPKVLTHGPEYLPQLAAWTNTYMLAITPAVRAAWQANGFTVTFFQTAQAPSATPTKPKLTLVT